MKEEKAPVSEEHLGIVGIPTWLQLNRQIRALYPTGTLRTTHQGKLP